MMCFFFNVTSTTGIYTTDTLCPYTTLFRSADGAVEDARQPAVEPDGLRHAAVGGLQRGRGRAAGRSGHGRFAAGQLAGVRSEEHTSELQSLMRISYAVFCLQQKNTTHSHLKLHLHYHYSTAHIYLHHS